MSFRNRQSTFKFYFSLTKLRKRHKMLFCSFTGNGKTNTHRPDARWAWDKLYFVLEQLQGRAVNCYWGKVINSTTVLFCCYSANQLVSPTFRSLFHLKTKQTTKKHQTDTDQNTRTTQVFQVLLSPWWCQDYFNLVILFSGEIKWTTYT